MQPRPHSRMQACPCDATWLPCFVVSKHAATPIATHAVLNAATLVATPAVRPRLQHTHSPTRTCLDGGRDCRGCLVGVRAWGGPGVRTGGWSCWTCCYADTLRAWSAAGKRQGRTHRGADDVAADPLGQLLVAAAVVQQAALLDRLH